MWRIQTSHNAVLHDADAASHDAAVAIVAVIAATAAVACLAMMK